MGREAAEPPSTDFQNSTGRGPEQPNLAPELGMLCAAGWTR